MKQIFFITGTDTGVGKTVLTTLLTRFLRERGANVAALKPVCSGDRGDTRAFQSAMNGGLALGEINPWHFRAAVAPVLAARRERKRVLLADVVAHVRKTQKRCEVVLIEGAGGLLSPLGENFDSRDVLVALRATPIIVCPNRLGAVNQVLLTLEALPPSLRASACAVLMSPPRPDAATVSNVKLLADLFDAKRIFSLPWFGKKFSSAEALKNPPVRRILGALVRFEH